MRENILIVEDQFIEANDLSSILENAGYNVCGIARSVEEANAIIEINIPDMVLIDIFLRGDLTGIDLAKTLTQKNIPFIYLSANSNQSTLEEVKATQPYGFLVKPFREKDILIALEIATYRHKHIQEVRIRDEKWLSELLLNIIHKEAEPAEKLLLLARAFQPFVHFDYILIDTDLLCRDFHSMIGFQRTNYDDYSVIDISLSEVSNIFIKDINELRHSILRNPQILYWNEAAFVETLGQHKINNHLNSLYGVQSKMIVPVIADQKTKGVIVFYKLQNNYFSNEQVELLRPLLPQLSAVVENIHNLIHLHDKTINKSQAIDLKNQRSSGFLGIVGTSPKLLYALDQVAQVAPYDTSVLILGETGSGKEGLVNVIQELSLRKNKPFIKINCAAIPESMVESELFGHEKGAFTGATERRIGKFEQAHGGTIFLDEIGEIPLDVQSKLLRVLQEKEIERLGGRQTIKIDVRIIAATNRNLHREVAKGHFRMDLYYRINVFPIHVPPLRERKEDIPLLADHFLRQQATIMHTEIKILSPQMLQKLVDYFWPGNIRQLQHLIERNVIINTNSIITSLDLPDDPMIDQPVTPVEKVNLQSITEVEKAHIMTVITNCKGKISGEGGAAEILQIPVTTLRVKMKKLGIQWQHSFLMLMVIFLFHFSASAQLRISEKKDDFTLLQVSAGFLTVIKEGRIDLDSTLYIASHRSGLSRIPIITEGIEETYPLNNCKWMDNENIPSALKQLKLLKGKDHVRQLLFLGAYYAFHPGFKKGYIDQAKHYLKRAKEESDALHLSEWNIHSTILLGKCYLKEKDIPTAKAVFMSAVTNATLLHDIKLQAKAFNYEGMYCPFLPPTTLFRISCLKKATVLYKTLHDEPNQINTLMDIAYLSVAAGKFEESQVAVKQSLLLQRSSGFPYTHYSTDLTAFLARAHGDYASELKLGMEEVKTAELTKDSIGLASFYMRVADGYAQDDNHTEESIVWYKKALNEYIKHGGDATLYRIFSNNKFIEYYLNGNKSVLVMLNDLLKNYPPLNAADEQSAYIAIGTCYENMEQLPLAEKYYLMAARLEERNRLTSGNINNGYVYHKLSRFYLHYRNYKKSKIYTLKYLSNSNRIYVDSLILAESYNSLFKSDSAAGDFGKMKNLYKYTALIKRLYTSTKNKQVEELNIRYQTLQKQNDLRMYKARNLLQVQQAKTTRTFSYIGLLILILIIVIILLRYISKQKSNRMLQLQKNEIDAKNIQLQSAIKEKDELLISKEWLLKEVHHRVKNNLQLVMSLLNSQTIYLKDEVALNAVMESRHRVQAMSLIHQMLYKEDSVSHIDMREYIRNLVEYLKDSFKTKLSIYFELRIEQINLDVSQAIPVGLILNELITNAIKYAFPHEGEHRIILSFTKSADEITLMVMDNGMGLPEDFDVLKTNSFGMKLIKGLTEDIRGHFTIEISNGTLIKMVFKDTISTMQPSGTLS